MVFQVAGSSLNTANPAAFKNMGVVDLCWYAGAGNMPSAPTSFIANCHAQGMGAIMQNSDSGSTENCGGQCDSYHSMLASAGLDAVGGESETGAEMNSTMKYLIFLNYGGQGSGGPTGNNNVWAKTGGNAGATVGAKGCSTFMETYTTSGMLSPSEIATEAVYNKSAGCFEVGLIVGSWSGNYGATVDTYIAMVNAMAGAGVTCAGFHYWLYDDSRAWGTFTSLISHYGANMTPIYKRVSGGGGGGGGGGGTPKPTAVGGPVLNVNFLVEEHQPGWE